MEVLSTAAVIAPLTEYRDPQSQRGLCFLPKRHMNVNDNELAIGLRLMRDSVVPVTFKLPRKTDIFSTEVYPDTTAGRPAMEAKDWLDGKNKQPVLVMIYHSNWLAYTFEL
jgi:coronin-1B/1C/6